MKVVFSVCLAFLVSFAAVEPAEAKRFGSGGFGKAFKTSPFKKASPFSQKKSPKKEKAAPANSQPLNGKNGAAPAKSKGMMGGLMGGLLAGGALAYLFGSGAFEGLQFMDVLIFALIGFVLFKLFFARRPAQQYAGYQGQPQNSDNQHFQSSGLGANQGFEEIPLDFPQGFDIKGFATRAAEHFTLVNKAWDSGDMNTVSEYLHPELLDQLQRQRAQLPTALNNEVLDVDAEIVRSENTDQGHLISVLFRGRVKDMNTKQESGIFDVWHMRREANGPWLIIGIEAE